MSIVKSAAKAIAAEGKQKRGRPPKMQAELLPCPFCGQAPKLSRYGVGDLKLVGIECACTKRDDIWCQWSFETPEAALAFWNRRAHG